MFSAQLADPSPAFFRPKVAPDPEIQRRLEEKLTEAVIALQHRRVSFYGTVGNMPGISQRPREAVSG